MATNEIEEEDEEGGAEGTGKSESALNMAFVENRIAKSEDANRAPPPPVTRHLSPRSEFPRGPWGVRGLVIWQDGPQEFVVYDGKNIIGTYYSFEDAKLIAEGYSSDDDLEASNSSEPKP